MQLYIERFGLTRETRILHFAPESGLSNYLRGKTDGYVAADFDVERYNHLTDVKFVDLSEPASYERFGKFDLILHNHVIEHIPYNYSALLLRLHRMLKPGGIQGFSVPIYGAHYSEHWGVMTSEEATSRFGQYDHIRRFSPVDIACTLGALFNLKDPDLEATFGCERLREINFPQDAWKGWNGHSIFWLSVCDCKLF